MIVLTDTGILLRLFTVADPQFAIVDRAVRTIQGRGDSLVFASQAAAEFWNVCTRPMHARGGCGLDVTEAERRLKLVEGAFPLLPELPTVYNIWRGLIVAHAVQGRQVHDARLAALMIAHGVQHILTLNPGDFARFPAIIPITPGSVVAPPPGSSAPSSP